jgi:hypothetical protein
LTTFHDYAEAAELTKTCSSLDGILAKKSHREVFVGPIAGRDSGTKHKPGAPIICTEFGGVNIKPKETMAANSDDWGYHTANDADDLLKRIKDLMMGIVGGKLVCGFVYTQLQVLYSFHRREKLPAGKVKEAIDAALSTYYEHMQMTRPDS